MVKSPYSPTLEEFRERAKSANLIPVYREVLADLETPVSALLKIDDGHGAFLLESVEGGKLGRYSFLGASPSIVFQSKGKQITIHERGKVRTYELEQGDPLDELRGLMGRYQVAPSPGLPPFFGGAVGYAGYDLVHFFENIPLSGKDEPALPDSLFVITDSIVIFDHLNHTMKVVVNAHVEGNAEQAYRDAEAQIEKLLQRLNAPLKRRGFGARRKEPLEIGFNRDKADFCRSIEKLREHIVAGDIFQAIASLRQEMRIESSPLDVYRALRTINPSPYMFYFRHENLALVGSSPEILVKLEGGRVRYRPLAGTRWRGKTEEEDARIAAGLLEDPKERAEHIMLVDLGRNDVGRVCKYNTVEVTELMAIERYSHVMHIVSNIEGEIDPKYDPYDLLRAVFPAGTVSGAPKVRAMQLIDQLEPTRRGPYGGAVGYFGFSGNLDCGIILRTIVIDGSRAYVQSGAGIVYDSDPEYEYNECMNKARGLIKAIEMAEQGELREPLGRDRR